MTEKHIILKGTFVLTLAAFISRFLGFFYRMYLSHTFGEANVGLYQLIFPVYTLGIAITCAGIQTALSRHVAGYVAKGKKKRNRPASFYFYDLYCFSLGDSYAFYAALCA